MHSADTQRLRLTGQTKNIGKRNSTAFYYNCTNYHDDASINHTIFHTILNTRFILHAMTVCDNWSNCIPQPESGKQDKLLDFIIQSVCGNHCFAYSA